jgi:hypothetical protein
MMYIKEYFNISSTPQGAISYVGYVASYYNTANMLVKASTPRLVQFLRLVEAAIYNEHPVLDRFSYRLIYANCSYR